VLKLVEGFRVGERAGREGDIRVHREEGGKVGPVSRLRERSKVRRFDQLSSGEVRGGH
jgi:hypothetical protein